MSIRFAHFAPDPGAEPVTEAQVAALIAAWLHAHKGIDYRADLRPGAMDPIAEWLEYGSGLGVYVGNLHGLTRRDWARAMEVLRQEEAA